MVPMRVSIRLASGAPKILPKHLESQPIQQTEMKIPGPGGEGQGREWNGIKPITSVMDS